MCYSIGMCRILNDSVDHNSEVFVFGEASHFEGQLHAAAEDVLVLYDALEGVLEPRRYASLPRGVEHLVFVDVPASHDIAVGRIADR